MSSVNQNIDFLDNIDAMGMHAGTSGPARGGDARSTHAQAADPERHRRIHLTDPGGAAPLERMHARHLPGG
jgi:hypothetical protein